MKDLKDQESATRYSQLKDVKIRMNFDIFTYLLFRETVTLRDDSISNVWLNQPTRMKIQ